MCHMIKTTTLSAINKRVIIYRSDPVSLCLLTAVSKQQKIVESTDMLPIMGPMIISSIQFDADALESMVGGQTFLDVDHLSIQSREQGKAFFKAYGYDVDSEDDLNRLWAYHRKAVTYVQDELLLPDERVPVTLSDPKELGDIVNILIMASTKSGELQRWANAILKVMHIFVHLENDLFAQFSTEIQDQILNPIQSHIHEDPVIGTTLGPAMGPRSIVLKKFEVKPFKATASSVTKLLAKRELVAFSLLDKIGVRIVTKYMFDVFRVLRYFVDQNIVSVAHNIPDQANNTLYPLNLFLETMEALDRDGEYTPEQMDKLLLERLQKNADRARYFEKINAFSSHDFRFVKFITRRLVRIENTVTQKNDSSTNRAQLSFFYPYEVQIVDYETYLKNTTGAASHELYKKRQVEKARERILGAINQKNSKN